MSEWISVKDRMPENHEDYLLIGHHNDCYIGHMDIHGDWYDDCGIEIEGISHWMPLPEPPEK